MAPFTGCRPTNQGSEGHLPYSATSLLSVVSLSSVASAAPPLAPSSRGPRPSDTEYPYEIRGPPRGG